MLVHDNRKNLVQFNKLDAGDVFIKGGEIYMKVHHEHFGKVDTTFNAVKLDVGQAYNIESTELVLEVRAVVNIESY